MNHLSHAREILPGHLPAEVQRVGNRTQIGSNRVERPKTLKQVEMGYIRLVVEEANGNHSQAARMLGINRRTLSRKLAEMKSDGVSECDG